MIKATPITIKNKPYYFYMELQHKAEIANKEVELANKEIEIEKLRAEIAIKNMELTQSKIKKLKRQRSK